MIGFIKRVNTYNDTSEMAEQHAVVLVITSVNLREVGLEVCNNSVILVRAIAVRGDAN